jgi:hypothetical protein
MKQGSISDRLVDYLQEAAIAECNVHFRADYQIATLIVLHCKRGDAVKCSPHVLATYELLGCHPDQVWLNIVKRRKAILRDEYTYWYDAAGNPRNSISDYDPVRIPKKPPATAVPRYLAQKAL